MSLWASVVLATHEGTVASFTLDAGLTRDQEPSLRRRPCGPSWFMAGLVTTGRALEARPSSQHATRKHSGATEGFSTEVGGGQMKLLEGPDWRMGGQRRGHSVGSSRDLEKDGGKQGFIEAEWMRLEVWVPEWAAWGPLPAPPPAV